VHRIAKLFAVTVCFIALFATLQGTVFASSSIREQNAQPLVTCSGNGCNGLDPVNTGCSATASTILTAPIKWGTQTVGTVNLRFSSACQTNWAQVVSSIGPAQFNAEVERDNGVDGPLLGYCVGVSDFCGQNGVVGSTFAYTDMVWARDVSALAFGEMLDPNSSQSGSACVKQQPGSPALSC
jgi:hypothetical protein